jgi:dTDP-4-amino-4,6-dideoxygalactose transaminase
MSLRFTHPYIASTELDAVRRAIESGHTWGDGPFTLSAAKRLTEMLDAAHVAIVTSGTDAAELAGIVADFGPGDEVIVPSYQFPSAGLSVALRGATPVFVDVDPRTGNINVDHAEAAITPNTRGITFVSYAGVNADTRAIRRIADAHDLIVIEDNCHSLGGTAGGEPMGRCGDLVLHSFQAHKNISCGEGGALVVNNPAYIERTEIAREKGTNRHRFLRGEVDRYTWVDLGSNYLPSDVQGAMLDAQLADYDIIQARRMSAWDSLNDGIAAWAENSGVEVMDAGTGNNHTAHLFYALLPDQQRQRAFIDHLAARGVPSATHFQPLHSADAGERFGRSFDSGENATSFASRIVRLPMHANLTATDIELIVDSVTSFEVGN